MPIQVNVTTKVNSASIRREQHNGREHFVIPSRTLPFDVVMNGGLYSRAQIEANFQSLEGTLAPLGHPTVNGAHVSAFSPEGINIGHVGAWNRNARIDGNRVYVEKWLDIEVANRTPKGMELVGRLEQLEKGEGAPIHTSVAAWVEREPAVNAEGYEWIAKITGLDHDAILLDEPGAATPEQGVGMMVNADQAHSMPTITANAGALVGESYRERERRIEQAAKARFATGADDYVWLADFTESQAVIVRNGGAAEVYGYQSEGGKIAFDAAGAPVARQESWVAIAANTIKKFLNPQARPAEKKEGEMPMTAEEKAELSQEIGAVIAANMKPLADKVEELAANQAASAKAASDAALAGKRSAVAAVHGEIVANALAGEALDAMHASVLAAAPVAAAAALAGNASQAPAPNAAPNPADYFSA